MAADNDVVGDWHEGCRSCSFADDCIRQGLSVDRGVGSNLDIIAYDYVTNLRHFHVPIAKPGCCIAFFRASY
jgi:hypothetical protein